MKQLFAPWRHEWVTSGAAPGPAAGGKAEGAAGGTPAPKAQAAAGGRPTSGLTKT